MSKIELPKITILEGVNSRSITTAKGQQKMIYGQRASLETEAMRLTIEVSVDGPNMGYPVGSVHRWNMAADLVPGRFGIELARKFSLVPDADAAAKPARVA